MNIKHTYSNVATYIRIVPEINAFIAGIYEDEASSAVCVTPLEELHLLFYTMTRLSRVRLLEGCGSMGRTVGAILQ